MSGADHVEVTVPSAGAVGGFGVRFAPLEDGDLWRRRVTNRACGHQTYAQSGRGKLEGEPHTLVGPGDEAFSFRRRGSQFELTISGDQPVELIRGWPRTTRRTFEAPRWARGPWLSGTWQGLTRDRVLDDLRSAIALGVPFVGRLVDAGWYDHSGPLFAPSRHFEPLGSLISAHRDHGWEVMLWIAPWIPVATESWRSHDRRGWLVKDPSGSSYVFPVVGDATIHGSYIDLTHPDAAAEWVTALGRLLDLGVSAFKLDFGEALPSDAVFAQRSLVDEALGTGPIDVNRNSYPLLMQMVSRRALGDDAFLVSRAAWTGSEELTAIWLGDQSSDISRFAGLQSVIYGLQSALDSGFEAVGLDVGGYFGDPAIPTMTAWQRTGLLFDFAFYHGLGERAPWRLAPEVMVEHRRLFDLAQRCEWRANDRVVVRVTPEGRLVAQRVGERHVAVADLRVPAAVALPPGEWRDVETGRRLSGDRTVECAPGAIFEIEGRS